MRSIISRFLADQTGATAIEYGLIVAVLSLTIVAGVGNAGNALQNMWSDLATRFDSAN